MTRTNAFAAALLLALSATFVQAIALPGPVAACSCMPDPPTMAEMAAEGGIAVVFGPIGRPLPDRTPMTVETWFHGDGSTDLIWVSGGSQMMTSCDPSLRPGDKWLMVLHGEPGGLYTYSPCVAGGVVGTPAGDAALAEALAAFGPGIAPPDADPTDAPPQAPTEASPLLGAGILWILVGLAAALVLFGAIIIAGLRRQPR